MVAVSDNSVVASLDDSLVILSLKSGIYYGVEGIAKLVWEHLDHPRSVRELSDAILKEYDVAPQQCVDDVIELIQDFIAHGLVQVDE